MKEESERWIEAALRQCAQAKEMGLSMMIRMNSEDFQEMMIVCTETEGPAIAALGQALAREYVSPSSELD